MKDNKALIVILVVVGVTVLLACCCTLFFVLVSSADDSPYVTIGEDETPEVDDAPPVVEEPADLVALDTPNYVFYYPQGYEDITNVAVGMDYGFAAESGASISVADYDYLNGVELDTDECDSVYQLFLDSDVKVSIGAVIKGPVQFAETRGQKTCTYTYEVSNTGSAVQVKYQIVQGDDLYNNYTTSIFYKTSDPGAALLKKAQDSFEVK